MLASVNACTVAKPPLRGSNAIGLVITLILALLCVSEHPNWESCIRVRSVDPKRLGRALVRIAKPIDSYPSDAVSAVKSDIDMAWAGRVS